MANQHHGHRHIKAPASAIFEAFVDPQQIVQWMPPKGATGRLLAFEPRAGGPFEFELTFHDWKGKTGANTDVLQGNFVEVLPDKIVITTDFQSTDPSFKGTMTMTWKFRSASGGTDVEVVADDVPVGIKREDHEKGIASSLGNLAKFVEPGK